MALQFDGFTPHQYSVLICNAVKHIITHNEHQYCQWVRASKAGFIRKKPANWGFQESGCECYDIQYLTPLNQFLTPHRNAIGMIRQFSSHQRRPNADLEYDHLPSNLPFLLHWYSLHKLLLRGTIKVYF